VGPGVMPNITAVATELAELDIVAVWLAAVFEHKDQLVLAAVERTHAGVVLDPDAEVFELAIDLAAGGQQLFGMAPVHENVVQRAFDAECREVVESLGEKGGEFGAVHLARGHREWPVMDR